MKIYTKKGDAGQTDLIGERVDKDNLRISTIGTLDELNSLLGMARTKCSLQNVCEATKYLQGAIFTISAIIATPKQSPKKAKKLQAPSAKNLEEVIDEIEKILPPLNNFILPGGHETAATLHHARSVCRRAERLIVALNKKDTVDADILKFINRTSDFLFIMARYVNHHYMLHETIWEGAKLIEVDEEMHRIEEDTVVETEGVEIEAEIEEEVTEIATVTSEEVEIPAVEVVS